MTECERRSSLMNIIYSNLRSKLTMKYTSYIEPYFHRYQWANSYYTELVTRTVKNWIFQLRSTNGNRSRKLKLLQESTENISLWDIL